MIRLIYETIMANPAISKEQKEKEKEYKQYVDTHVENVKTAWNKMQTIKDISSHMEKAEIDMVDMFIIGHDSSKYDMDEWEPYRKFYYPVDEYEKQSAKAEYERAVQHHYLNNVHHPEHWKERRDEMPTWAVVEMCCDWIAVSMVKGGTAYDFFHNVFDKSKLGENQIEQTEYILSKYYDIK